jgi:hypothetical protein
MAHYPEGSERSDLIASVRPFNNRIPKMSSSRAQPASAITTITRRHDLDALRAIAIPLRFLLLAVPRTHAIGPDSAIHRVRLAAIRVLQIHLGVRCNHCQFADFISLVHSVHVVGKLTEWPEKTPTADFDGHAFQQKYRDPTTQFV